MSSSDGVRREAGITGSKEERMLEVRRRLIEEWRPLLDGVHMNPQKAQFQVERVTGGDDWGEIVVYFGDLSEAEYARLQSALKEVAHAQGWHDTKDGTALLKGNHRLWGLRGSESTMWWLASGEVEGGLDAYSPLVGPVPDLLTPRLATSPPSPTSTPPSASSASAAGRTGCSGLNMM